MVLCRKSFDVFFFLNFLFVLKVIKKVMEMDEAVPFNAPVDAVAQGLPVSVNGYLVHCICWMSINSICMLG